MADAGVLARFPGTASMEYADDTILFLADEGLMSLALTIFDLL
jgi:hypothetical protein